MGIVFLLLNFIVYRKNAFYATHMFTTVSRNYKYLIVGDDCDYKKLLEGDTNIAFLSPVTQSSYATFEFVRRLYSLLDENNGTLLMVKRNYEDTKKEISVFDVPYLHENTLNKLGKGRMRIWCHLPFLFNPIGSLKVLFEKRNKSIPVECECPNQEINQFCESRNIKVKYYKIR